MKQETPPLKPHMLKSFLIHAFVVLVICVALYRANSSIQIQERAFLEDLQTQEEQLQEKEKEAAEEMMQEELAEQVTDEFRAVIEQELDTEVAEVLKDSLQEQIKDWIDDAVEDEPLYEMSPEELTELAEQLRKMSMSELQKQLEDMKKDMLLAMVRKKIKDEVAPDIKRNIEEELKNHTGRKIKENLKRSRKLTDVDKQAISEILPEIEAKLREEVTAAVKKQSIPIAAKKLTRMLDKQLKKLNLNSDKFTKRLKKEITEALERDMSQNKPHQKSVSLQTREMINRRSAEDIAEARKEIKEALSKLEKVNKKQEALKRDTIRETAAKDAQDEMDIRKEIKEAQRNAKKAIDKAGTVTLKMSHQLTSARTQIMTKTAEIKAKEASTYVKQEIVDEAKKTMQVVNDDLKKKIAILKKMDNGLQEEQHALEKIEVAAKDLKALLGEKKTVELKEKMKKAATDRRIIEAAKFDVKKGTGKTQITDTLDGFEVVESLQELSDVMKAADGRMMDDAGELLGGIEAGLLGPGSGKLPPGRNTGSGMRFAGNGYGFFNRKLYEEFSKDMRERLNPKKAYEEQDENDGLHSRASQRKEQVAATMVVLNKPDNTAGKSITSDKKKKTVPKPTFHTIAFGAADYAIDPITIDGDLKDWGELRHPQKHQFYVKGNKIPKSKAVDVYMRWSPKGLYLCYTVKSSVPINTRGPVMWKLTGLELFIDVRNRRKGRMENSPTAQQLFLCPFGVNSNPKITFGEAGRGHRGLKMLKIYPDREGLRGKARGKIIPGGYQVECFVKRSSLAHPMLTPGMYLAINHSINLGNKFETQWSAPKSVQTWNRPDTWGDVLLLGSDARVAFKDHKKHSEKLQGVLPGDSVYIEITDPDMNLYEIKKDRIMATVKVENSKRPVMLVLKETKLNSGIFAGSFATQAYFKKAKANTLNIRGGDTILLTYVDARSGYGEKNRKVKARLAVGWPVTKISK